MWKELEYAIMYDACVAIAFLEDSERRLPMKLQYLINKAYCTGVDGDKYAGMTQIATLVGRALLHKE